MTVEEFELLFRMECRDKKACAALEWRPKFQRVLARCNAEDKVIMFSLRCLSLDYATAIWVIRHELAHLFDYIERGGFHGTYHNNNWRKWCRVMGCPATTYIAA